MTPTKGFTERTMYAYQDNNLALNEYRNVAKEMLHLYYPLLSQEELDMALNYSINKRVIDTPAQIDNNYKKQTVDSSLLKIADYIMQRRPIITSAGVMFHRHGEVPNPIYELIDGFVKGRKKLKRQMFSYSKGSENYEKYNLLQTLAKIDQTCVA